VNEPKVLFYGDTGRLGELEGRRVWAKKAAVLFG
jgi:hypothetical protein